MGLKSLSSRFQNICLFIDMVGDLACNVVELTLLGLGLIKINDVSANFNNPRPSLILNN